MIRLRIFIQFVRERLVRRVRHQHLVAMRELGVLSFKVVKVPANVLQRHRLQRHVGLQETEAQLCASAGAKVNLAVLRKFAVVGGSERRGVVEALHHLHHQIKWHVVDLTHATEAHDRIGLVVWTGAAQIVEDGFTAVEVQAPASEARAQWRWGRRCRRFGRWRRLGRAAWLRIFDCQVARLRLEQRAEDAPRPVPTGLRCCFGELQLQQRQHGRIVHDHWQHRAWPRLLGSPQRRHVRLQLCLPLLLCSLLCLLLRLLLRQHVRANRGGGGSLPRQKRLLLLPRLPRQPSRPGSLSPGRQTSFGVDILFGQREHTRDEPKAFASPPLARPSPRHRTRVGLALQEAAHQKVRGQRFPSIRLGRRHRGGVTWYADDQWRAGDEAGAAQRLLQCFLQRLGLRLQVVASGGVGQLCEHLEVKQVQPGSRGGAPARWHTGLRGGACACPQLVDGVASAAIPA